MDIIRIKAELFCQGVRCDLGSELPIPYLPNKRASLSEGKCFILFPGKGDYPVNVAVRERFVKGSPFHYSPLDKKIFKDNKPFVDVEDVQQPEWYSLKLPTGKSFNQVVQIHLADILASALSDFCSFKADGKGCKYCALRTGPESRNKDPQEIAYCVSHLEGMGLRFSELNLNAGTLRGEDRGSNLYLKTIQEVRKVSSIPIAAQICPPDNFKWIRYLHEEGLNTISFNLEIYDEQRRKEVCPGKSTIPRERYFEAMEYAVELFGRNQVSSWLIAGLEPIESTLTGAEAIAALGAIPFVSVFRPLTGTEFENMLPPPVEDVVMVFRRVGEIMRKHQVNPKDSTFGCVRCNCCSALMEAVELNTNSKHEIRNKQKGSKYK
jgi:radical SAM protein (TIGR04043 family)